MSIEIYVIFLILSEVKLNSFWTFLDRQFIALKRIDYGKYRRKIEIMEIIYSQIEINY